MGKGGRSGSGGAVTAASLPAYASKYGVLHLAAAGPQAETLLDAGEGRVRGALTTRVLGHSSLMHIPCGSTLALNPPTSPPPSQHCPSGSTSAL